jgi:hypothetical protein
MDGYQLTAALVQSVVSLAWPAAVFGAILIFRQKLAELLPALTMKFKDFEFSFRLAQAEKDAASLPEKVQEPGVQPTPEEKSKFEKVAELSPRAAILEVRAEIEEAVRALAQSAGLLTSKVQSVLGLTRLLRNKDVIDPQVSGLLDDLRVMGNYAAHNPQAPYTKADALKFRELADQVISELEFQNGFISK